MKRQIRIDWHHEIGFFITAIPVHTRAMVAFSHQAAEEAGGVTEVDEDDYIVGVKYEPDLANKARNLLGLPEVI